MSEATTMPHGWDTTHYNDDHSAPDELFEAVELPEADDEDFTAPTGFVCDDEQTLGWVLRTIGTARERMAERAATGQAHIDRLRDEIRRIEEWTVRVNAGDAGKVAYFEEAAKAMLRTRREADPDGPKFIPTPYGKVKSRTPAAKPIRPVDGSDAMAALMAWADGMGYIEKKPVLKWGDLVKECTVNGTRLLAAGEVVPGVEVDEPVTTYSVDVA